MEIEKVREGGRARERKLEKERKIERKRERQRGRIGWLGGWNLISFQSSV